MSRVALKTEEQERRAEAEREANARAAVEGRALPSPNLWDRLDPTKVPANATPEEIHQSFLRFQRLCQPRARIRHRL